jgi:hypothetical protein
MQTDFDFLHGRWRVHHRRLRERLTGCAEWITLTSTAECRPVLGGIGNVDSITLADAEGLTVRLYDLERRVWTIHWADSRKGRLDPPLEGSFKNGVGLFFGDDQHEGRPVRVRFLWNASGTPRWEQAYSIDGGATWETNWIMDFERDGDG